MGIQKAIQTQFGVTANFWTISEVHINFDNSTLGVILKGYSTKAAKNAGAAPFPDAIFIELNGPDFPANFSAGALMTIIKTRPEFAGAVDA